MVELQSKAKSYQVQMGPAVYKRACLAIELARVSEEARHSSPSPPAAPRKTWAGLPTARDGAGGAGAARISREGWASSR